MKPLEVRSARISDCAGIARVQVDSYLKTYADIVPKSYLDYFTYAEQEKDGFWYGGFADMVGNPFWVVDENCP